MTTLDLLKARATTAGVLHVFKLGEVPANPGDSYMVLSLPSGRPVNRRVSGDAPSRARRLAVQIIARTDDGLSDLSARADAAFDGVTLTDLAGAPFMVREELDPFISRDADAGGYVYTLLTYRF